MSSLLEKTLSTHACRSQCRLSVNVLRVSVLSGESWGVGIILLIGASPLRQTAYTLVGFYFLLKQCLGAFPGGPVVKSPPASAEDTGSVPSLGRPHTLQGIGARAPQLGRPRCSSRSLQLKGPRAAPREATALKSLPTTTGSGPRSPQVETARSAAKTQCGQKERK